MRHRRITVLFQCVAAAVLWLCGPPVLHAQTSPPAGQETQADKTPKVKKAKKAVTDATAPQTTAPTEMKKHVAPAPVSNASAADIQAAKAGGKVWVNTESGVYHKSGKWFGSTKQGKFMTEQDAVKAGFRAAKNEK